MEKKQTKRVVGIKYDEGHGVPRIVVKGNGNLAEAIIKDRGMNGPPLIRDKELLNQLYRLPMDAEIGSELFELVAILLVHVFAIDERSRRNK